MHALAEFQIRPRGDAYAAWLLPGICIGHAIGGQSVQNVSIHDLTPNWLPPDGAMASVEAGHIHLWRISIDPATAREVIAARRRLLNGSEIERAGRFYTARLSDQWVLGRGALRAILSRYTGIAPTDIELDVEAHGKPVLRARPGAEIPPAFNLTHAGDLALLAVMRGGPIGIDIERARHMRDADAVARRFFSAAECEQYFALEPDDRPDGFFRCWTRKEAFIKAIGEGLSRPLRTFDVSLGPGEPPRLLRVENEPDEPAAWSLYAFDPSPGYVAAVAARTRSAELSFFEFE